MADVTMWLAGVGPSRGLDDKGFVSELKGLVGKEMQCTQNYLQQSWPVFLSLSNVLLRGSCALIERQWRAWWHHSYLKITKEFIFTSLCICSMQLFNCKWKM